MFAKRILSASILSLALASASESHGRSLHPETFKSYSQIYSFNIDPQLTNGSTDNIEGGDLVINRIDGRDGTATLKVYFKRLGYDRPPLEVKLPITSQSTDQCGAEVYFASKDQRPVDGFFKSLTIVSASEWSKAKCPTVYEKAGTAIKLITESPGFGGPIVRTESVFFGTELHRPSIMN